MVLRKTQDPQQRVEMASSSIPSTPNEQPSIKRQRIEGLATTSTNSLDLDSGNSSSTSSTSSSSLTLEVLDGNGSENGDNNNVVPVTKLISNNLSSIKDEEVLLFQLALGKQCLCGLDEKTLKKPFEYYQVTNLRNKLRNSDPYDEVDFLNNRLNRQDNGGGSSPNIAKYIKSLKHWPEKFLLQFLSNLQLLFNVYLKQNEKGNICGKIMELCDCLIRNESNIFDDLLELCNSDEQASKFVEYMACKVLTNFLIIIKDEIDQEWLTKVVNKIFIEDKMTPTAVKRVSFSLDIIQGILEWKDHDDEHPLEEEACFVDLPAPPIESNYFATSFQGNSSLPAYLTHNSSSSSNSNRPHQSQYHPMQNEQGISQIIPNGDFSCHIVQLTDSESFDTTHIKNITIKTLENKWPALVNNVSQLIKDISPARPHHRVVQLIQTPNIRKTENCILTFLSLWENIISVRANLSVVETLPFYKHLINFESLLNQNISSLIYKQMLQLFNEALCYGSTLALQDVLPEETCALAHQIVRHVKDYRIFESMPRQTVYGTQSGQNDDNLNNLNSLIGLGCQTVHLNESSFEVLPHTISDMTVEHVAFDKALLQKMTLLVIKSVAVSVKEIRSDSSDSSIDSSDQEAFAEMVVIERSIRDVLRKLESFIKNTLEFHPDSHFSKILIHLFNDQDDHLIEAMVCLLDVTSAISFRNNSFPELVAMLNPVYTFLEFLKMISMSSDLLLDLLVSNETCFLLYLLRFLKYIRSNWAMFEQSCRDSTISNHSLEDCMSVLIRLRFKISRLVAKSLFPYDIAPVLRLLESCENLYEGNELS